MFHKKTIRDVNIKNKTVLLRVAYDVPVEKKGRGMSVVDDTRIRATLPTLRYLLKNHCRVLIVSWLNRPHGIVVEKYRLDPVARSLSKLIHKKIQKINNCIGPEVTNAVEKLKLGQILMLENTRFHPEEQKNDPGFARELVKYADFIVFDAFGHAHRRHASTTGILSLKPSVAGLLVEKEIKTITGLLERPKRPFIVILGGAKIADKVDVMHHLLPKANALILGGGLANTFMKARGVDVQKSLVEGTIVTQGKKQSSVSIAKNLLRKNATHPYGHKIVLPVDFRAGNRTDHRSNVTTVNIERKERLRQNWMFLDIGPQTIQKYAKIIQQARSVVWNGPLGLFETEKFSNGTKKIASLLAGQKKSRVVICGGDTETIVKQYGLAHRFYHVSTGGGASLTLIAGKKLPAIELLPDKK